MAQQKNHSFDVIVVGSGASGGWACKRLAEAGLKVALLEAGRPQSDKNFTEHKPEFELKYRNKTTELIRKTRPIQVKFGVCNEYTYDWFVNDLEEPYTTPTDKPFNWMGRLRMTGGRTNVWGRVSLRFSDWDFKSPFTTVADALASGNCTLISNAMACKVLMDPERNRARGILYVERNTRQTREIHARAVILCAQSQESVRILLNSATPQYSNGLANSSGVLGHYLTAHVRSGGGSGEFPAFGAKPSLGGPVKPLGIYIARFLHFANTPSYKKFLRAFGYEAESSTEFNWDAPGLG